MALGIAFFDAYSSGYWHKVERYTFTDDCRTLVVIYKDGISGTYSGVSDLEQVDKTIYGMFDGISAFVLREMGE